MSDFRDHIRAAIDHFGSQAELAKAIGRSQQYISWLLTTAGQVSAETAVRIDEATNGKYPRWLFCPQFFPPPQGTATPSSMVAA